jgi:hypothetical protein
MMVMAGCGGAGADDASASTDSDLKKTGKGMSLAAFESAMKDTQNWADNDPCSFSVTKEGKGLKLVLTADGKTATLSVSESDTITLSEKDGDGSTQTYKIPGAGVVKVINADDAFESIEIVPNKGDAATCEIDF